MVAAGASATYTGGGAATTLDNAISLSDADSVGDLAGATVSIGSGFISGDTLSFTSQASITGSYDAAHGILTLSGTATLAAYQAALNSVAYSFNPTDSDPTDGGADTSRTISWSVTDGVASSTTATSTLDTAHAVPTVSSIDTVGSNPNNAASEQFTVTFSEAVTGVDASDFSVTPTGTVADTGIVVTPVNGSTYTVTVDGVTGDGTLRLDLNSSGTGIADAAGNAIAGGYASGQVFTIEHTPPSVSSIDAVGSNPNNAASEQFTVTFSEAVTGVDASDFSATPTGTVADTGIVVTPVNGSTYTVTVDGVTGDGTLRLDLNSSGTGIADAAGNAIAGGYASGQVFTIEHTPPSVSSIDTVGSNPNNATSEQFTVTFSEAVTGVGASDFSATPTGTVADTGIVVTPVNGSTYTVTVDGVSGDGTLRLDLNSSGTGIADAAGNAIAGGYASGQIHTIEHTPPSVSSIDTVGSNPNNATSEQFTVTFSEAVTGVDASDFALTDTDTAAGTIASVSGSGSTYTVTVDGVSGDGTLRLDLNSSGTGIADAAGNAIAGGYASGQVYTIEHTPPAVASITTVGSSPNSANSEQFTVTFTEAVTGVAAGDFALTTTNTPGGAALTDTGISSISGSGATYTVTVGGVAGDGTMRLDLNANSTGIVDAAGNGATSAFTGGGVYTIEHTPPTVVAGATATFTGGDPAKVLDSGLTVTDPVNTTLAGATVSVGAGFLSGDTLNFTSQTGITGSYDSTIGVLSLSGTATIADYRAALESITYSFSPSDGDPTGGGADASRTIEWSVNDKTLSSTTATSTLAVAHAAPVVTAGASATFTGGGAATTLDGGLTVSDADSGGDLASATVSIGSGFISGDTLNFTSQSGITGSYDSTTGALSLTGTATIADYQAALESITYSFSPSDGDPTGGGADASRTIEWSVNDQTLSSTTATSTLIVNPPPLVVTAANISVTGGSGRGGAFKIGDIVTASWNDTSTGDDNSDAIAGVTFDFSQLGGGSAVAATDNGGVWTATYTIAAGDIDTTGANIALTATDAAGNATTAAGAGNVAVDDVQPTVASTAIVVSGGTGAGGAFETGDTVTASWDDSAADAAAPISWSASATSGDSPDPITSVTFDFSQFGGGTAVAATDNGGVWTASYLITEGDIDTTTAHVGLTATDAAGNAITIGGGPVTIDDTTVAPTIAGAVAGQTTTSEAPVNPFANVTVGDANSGATETLTITLSGSGGVLSGAGLTGGNGSYALSGTAAAVTAELDALSFTSTAGQPGTSGTTTFTLADASSAFATPTVNSAATVTDIDPSGTGWGDVHMVTFQGLDYDFQAVGDFTLAKGTSAADPFDVQIQTSPWASMVSVTTEIAAQVGGNAVQFDLDGDVLVNGVLDTALGSAGSIQALDGGSITRTSADSYLIDWASGESLTVTNVGSYFNETVTLSAKDGAGSVEGLLGSNTSQATDIQLADGTVLNAPTDSQLLGVYAQSWSVADSASLLNDNTSLPLAMTNDGDAATPFDGRSFLDLAGLNPASATLGFKEDPSGAFGTLTIQSGGHETAMTLLGQYAAAGFGIASDGHGGTFVDYTPPKVSLLG